MEPFGGSRTDQGVQLVDEQDDIVRLDDLLHDDLEPFLELAAVFGARDQRAEVERYHTPVQDVLRYVGIDDPLGKTLDDRGLADAGLADDDGIVLGPAGEDLKDDGQFLDHAR